VAPARIALVWHRRSQNAAVGSFVEVTRNVLRSEPQPAVSIETRSR
jgi:hypothetical protein